MGPFDKPAEDDVVEAPVSEPAEEPAPDEEPDAPVYAVELAEDVNGVQFNVDGQEVELDQDSPRFETTNVHLHKSLCELEHLQDAGGDS